MDGEPANELIEFLNANPTTDVALPELDEIFPTEEFLRSCIRSEVATKHDSCQVSALIAMGARREEDYLKILPLLICLKSPHGPVGRSEERRVGKDGSCEWSR